MLNHVAAPAVLPSAGQRRQPHTRAGRPCRRYSRAAAGPVAVAQGVQPLADSAIAGSDRLFELAVLDAPTASLVASTLSPLFAVGTLLFIIRIVMTWYPNIKDDQFPWRIVYLPTEPLLVPMRKLVGGVGGVDVSPIVWVALISFGNEILLGKQGLLVLLASKT